MKNKNRALYTALYIFLGLLAVFSLFPTVFLLFNSFKSQQEIVASPMAPPKSLDFSYILNAAEKINLLESLFNTIIITVCSVVLIIVVSSFAAWAIVRTKRNMATILFLAFSMAMLIPFQSEMYPLVSLMEMLGLKNTFGLILMYGGFGISMSVLLFQGFIKGIPVSLEEAAMIDGAGIFQVYREVLMPLLKPTIVTVAITNAVWIWNDYLLPFLVIGNNESKTLTLSMYYAKSLSGQYGNPWELIFPAVLLCMIPILVIYMILQKQVIEGITDGAVKG